MGPITPYNDILRLDELGLNHSEIERSLNGLSTRKTIISVLKKSAECGLHYPLDPPLSDLELHRLLHPKKDKNIRMPNLEKTIFQINLPGQSIADVWREYKSKNEFAYGKTTFQNLINDNISQYQTDTYESILDLMYVNDAFTNEMDKKIHVLFGRIKHSNVIMFTVIKNNRTRSWINAIIDILHQLGGLPKEIHFCFNVPKRILEETDDCLKYYGIEVSSRETKKTDEFYLWTKDVLSKLNSIDGSDLSPFMLLRESVVEYNEHPYYKNGKSFTRAHAWLLEKKCFRDMPEQDYDLCEYIDVKVQMNRHIEIDGCYYSVPFDYRHESLSAFITEKRIRICYLDEILCDHIRLKEDSGAYSTLVEHLMDDNRIPFGEVSGKSLRSWAKKIGTNTEYVINTLLCSRTYEVQAYKICNTILHYANKYGSDILEKSCYQATVNNSISYRYITETCKYISTNKTATV